MNRPIPTNPLGHCVLLFERRENSLPQFLEAFLDRLPGADVSSANWTSVAEPRPCAFGPIIWQRWKWHILFDLEGMPPSVAAVLSRAQMSELAQESVENHQMCCMIFLTEAPETAQPGEIDRALARSAWAMLDAGADVLIWPRTGLGWHRQELEDFAPETFDPGSSPA